MFSFVYLSDILKYVVNAEALSGNDRKSVQRSFGKISLSSIPEQILPLRIQFDRRDAFDSVRSYLGAPVAQWVKC